MNQIELTTDDALLATDLREWLKEHSVEYADIQDPESMGTSETLALIAAGSATLQAAMWVVREWLQARRTRITAKSPTGRSFTIDSGTDDETLLTILRELSGPDDAANQAPVSAGD